MFILQLFSVLILYQISMTSATYPVVTMTADVVNTSTPYNKEIYSTFVTIKQWEVLQINFTNINENISFIVFQAHTQFYKFLAYQGENFKKGVERRNVGLYSSKDSFNQPFYIHNINSDVDIYVYVSVHGYGPKDPIPGGCSMETLLPTAPYVEIETANATIMVDAPAPMDHDDPKCLNIKSVTLIFYVLYLPGFDHSEETYFDGIKKMMSLESVIKNAIFVDYTFWNTRRMVSKYPGTDRIFIAVARTRDGYSMYAPASESGCIADECFIGDTITIIFNIATLCIGAFVCYMGQRYFYTSSFFITFYTASIIFYILITSSNNQNEDGAQWLSMGIGVLFAFAWLAFWYTARSPSFIILIGTFGVGCLYSSILYYRCSDAIDYLRFDLNFWSLFFSIALLLDFALLLGPNICYPCTTAILGSYMMIYSLSHFWGSNLKYILINVIRRANVANFNDAVLIPPMQYKDQVLTGLWVGLSISGLVFQFLVNRGRSPYPERPPRLRLLNYFDRPTRRLPHGDSAGTSPPECTERTPLLS